MSSNATISQDIKDGIISLNQSLLKSVRSCLSMVLPNDASTMIPDTKIHALSKQLKSVKDGINFFYNLSLACMKTSNDNYDDKMEDVSEPTPWRDQ